MKRILMLLPLALFLTTFTASATSVTYPAYVVAANTYTTTPFAGTFLLPEFDPLLGVLTKVTLTFSFNWNGLSASVHNHGTTVGSYNFAGQFTYTLIGDTLSGGLALFATTLYNTGAHTISPGQTVALTVGPTSGSDTEDLTPTSLASFYGTGQLSYDLLVDNLSNGALSGNVDFTQSALGLAEMDVTYDYNELPEPATMAFAGIGLLALGFLGRRLARR